MTLTSELKYNIKIHLVDNLNVTVTDKYDCSSKVYFDRFDLS